MVSIRQPTRRLGSEQEKEVSRQVHNILDSDLIEPAYGRRMRAGSFVWITRSWTAWQYMTHLTLFSYLNFLANDASINFYCSPTDVGFQNYILSKMILYIIEMEMQTTWKCFNSIC